MNLYISDLDGTLLNEKAKLSSKSTHLINKILSKNINFTIATARTPATVTDILNDINLSLPVIVMNGCAIYDIKENTYLFNNKLNPSLAKIIKEKIITLNISPFIYTLQNNHIFVYYNTLEHIFQQEFYNQRKISPFKTFVNKNLTNYNNILYFTILDCKTKIETLYEEIKNIKELTIIKYKDIYFEDCYVLEILDSKSSKATAINYLKQKYKFNKIISFGDNTNDIPMFNISDECYSVQNAVDTLKEISTGVIGLNTEDSVAKYIYNIIK